MKHSDSSAKKLFFTSDRYFILFDYYPSHSQLLLRSQLDNESHHNIDIMCIGVDHLSLPTSLWGIDMTNASDSTKDSSFKIEINTDSKSYYIQCAGVLIYENTLAFNDSILAFSNVDRGKLITSLLLPKV